MVKCKRSSPAKKSSCSLKKRAKNMTRRRLMRRRRSSRRRSRRRRSQPSPLLSTPRRARRQIPRLTRLSLKMRRLIPTALRMEASTLRVTLTKTKTKRTLSPPPLEKRRQSSQMIRPSRRRSKVTFSPNSSPKTAIPAKATTAHMLTDATRQTSMITGECVPALRCTKT